MTGLLSFVVEPTIVEKKEGITPAF